MHDLASINQVVADMIRIRYLLLDSAEIQNGELKVSMIQAQSMVSTIDDCIKMLRGESI